MTVAEAQSLLRYLLGDKDTSDTYSSTNTLLLLNAANRHTWHKIANIAPHLCYEDKYVTVSAGSATADLATAGEAEVLVLLGVYQMQQSGAIADSNRATPIPPCNPIDIEKETTGSSPFAFDSRLRHAYDGQSNLVLRYGGAPVASATYILARLIRVAAALTLTTDNLLGGRFTHLHDLVVYRAVRVATDMTGERGNRFKEMENDAWNEAIPTLRQTYQEPMGVRNVLDWD